jgi:putative zinc finger protein
MCPCDDAIAAYVDGALAQEKQTQLETHLAQCEPCRSIIADLVKLQRDTEFFCPPLTAAKKVLSLAPKVRTRSRLMWAPVAAVALMVFASAIVMWHGSLRTFPLGSPPAASAPVIAKVEPIERAESAIPDITREPLSAGAVPIILTPLQSSTVERDRLEFTWKPVARPRYYQISVLTSDGDLLWTGRTEDSSLRLPRRVALKHGTYFVLVTAYLIDGQVAKSSPTKFVIER